ARSAIAAIAQRHEAGAVGDERAKPIDTPAQRAPVAVEIENYRLLLAWRHMPDDHALAVGRVEHDLLRLRQSRRSRHRAKALGKILQRSLREIEQHDERDVAEQSENEKPLQCRHAR